MKKIKNKIIQWCLNEYREDQQKIIVHRTLEGTLMGIAALLSNVVMTTLMFSFCHRTDKNYLAALAMSGFALIISAFMLVSAYHPKNIDTPFRLKTKRQLELGIRMTRLTAIEFPILVGTAFIFGEESIWTIIVLSVFILTDLLFSIYIYIVGRRGE